jgi:hypothetical protein
VDILTFFQRYRIAMRQLMAFDSEGCRLVQAQ